MSVDDRRWFRLTEMWVAPYVTQNTVSSQQHGYPTDSSSTSINILPVVPLPTWSHNQKTLEKPLTQMLCNIMLDKEQTLLQHGHNLSRWHRSSGSKPDTKFIQSDISKFPLH